MDPTVQQVTPPQTIIPPVQPPIDSPKHANFPKILLMLLGILILLGVIGGAYYLGAKQHGSNSETMSALPTKAPTPTPDPTASWKTYAAPTIRMTVKYPQDWTVLERQSQGKVYGVTIAGGGGSIDLAWGNSGVGGACTDGNTQSVNFGGQVVNACHTIANNGDETWGLLYRQIGNTTVAATVTASSCNASGCGPRTQQEKQQTLATTKSMMLTLLSHIVFTDQNSAANPTPIAGWVYDSGNFFNFQYPNSWLIKQNFNPPYDIFLYDPSSGSPIGNGNSIIYVHSLGVAVINSSMTISSYIDSIKSKQIAALAPDFKTKTILLNGVQVEIYYQGGEGTVGWYLPFSNGSHIVEFGPLSTDPSQDSIELQIVKTFKFTQ